MSDTVNIFIDNVPVAANKGETILSAAIRNGINIPNLCYHKKISHTGSCRLCIVRIEGNPKIVTSCTTPAEEGQKITAFSPELEAARKTVLDLQLSDHNDDCINCYKDGTCELQDMAFQYDLGTDKRKYPRITTKADKCLDTTSQVVDFDSSKCIQCGRCIKACDEIQGKGVLSFMHRGIKSTVKTGTELWVDSTCDGCGECVQICPVGALSLKPVNGKRIRSKDVEKSVNTTCPYCGVGCQLQVGTKKDVVNGVASQDRIIKITGVDTVPNQGSTCVKGRFGTDFVNHPDRLRKPLIRKDGKLVEVEWAEAIEYTAKRFDEIKKKNGAEALAGLSSARVTNENNYLFQKFVRSVMGSPNVDHCARLCHASTVAGLAISFGSGAMTNSIAELEYAKVILVTGSNTTETHPVISTYIKRAVQKHGAKLIVVDPRQIDLTRYATMWLRQRNGTDIAWLNGMVQAIIANGWENKDFIANHTENY
ncbi:MAG TPA: molybdopterin-dependent oxidoreductase, partial [Spirochaetales bacterium]|nr:molybdopterin-dependent oxidoreductase [Spirochaetales bacterium]